MRPRLLIAALTLLVACSSGGAPHYEASDLAKLVLPREHAPKGTELDMSSSGFQSLEDLAEDDRRYRDALHGAGFRGSYFNVFISSGLIGKDTQKREGAVIAISFVVLFESAEKASEGLRIIEGHVREEAPKAVTRPIGGLGEEGFGLGGDVRQNRPPGYYFAWRSGNGVFGLIATSPAGQIDESATRALADRMETRARRFG